MDIIKVIQETATWIEKVNKDYEFNLYRTPELMPDQHYIDIRGANKEIAINEVIAKRSRLLNEANVDLIPVNELSNYGSIMLFDADNTVWDGAPEVESAFYVDIMIRRQLTPG